MAQGDVTPVIQRPMFRFTTSTERPTARVLCLSCGWKATGDDPRKVYPQADRHVCPVADNNAS